MFCFHGAFWQKRAGRYGLPEPQTEAFPFTKNDKAILSLVHKYQEMTQKELAMELERVKYYLNKMKKQQIIKRVGSSHNGHWELLIEKPGSLPI